jgi:hypothetical protein
MPYDDPDRLDPMMLVGVALPAGRASQVEMVRVFAEEYARMGFDEERILGLFQRPFYAGAHNALRELGEEAVRGIVRQAAGVWQRVRIVDRVSAAAPAAGPCILQREGGDDE